MSERDTPGERRTPPAVADASRRRRLSHNQKALWVLGQLHPGDPAYNVAVAARLDGPWVPALFERTYRDVCRQHDVLQWRFENDGGNPRAIPSPFGDDRVRLHDLRAESVDRIDLHVRRLVAEPFDLTAGGLLRLHLLQTGARQGVVLSVAHQSVADRDALGRLQRELLLSYSMAASGREPPGPARAPLGPSAPSYDAFVRWQDEWLDRHADAARALWSSFRGACRDAIPDDRTWLGTSASDPPGATLRFTLPADVGPAIARLCDADGLTADTFYFGVFQVALTLLADATPLVAWMASERQGDATRDVIGDLTNPVVIPPHARRPEGPARQHLAEACAHASRFLGYRHLPVASQLAALGEASAVHAGAPYRYAYSHRSASTMADAFEHADRGRVITSVGDVVVRAWPVDHSAGQVPLWLEVVDGVDGDVRLVLRHATAWFDARTVQRVGELMSGVLADIAREPEVCLGELERRAVARQQEQVEAWNAQPFSVDLDLPISRRVEAITRRDPARPALVWQDCTYTYGFVESRANQLAHWLLDHGVAAGAFVAVYMERSPELVVCLLAIQKAGGAYMPIAPDLPPARIEFMLEDARPAIMLSDAPRAASCPVGVVRLDDWAFHGEPTTPLPDTPSRHDAAYLIYTSGSTGVPKGVPNLYGGITNHVAWLADRCPLDSTDRVMLKTAHSFDVSYCEITWALVSGATLVIAAPGGHSRPRYLGQLIREQRVTAMHVGPYQLRAMLDADPEATASLRVIISAGEALPLDLVHRMHALGSVRLFNLYGPTEAAVGVAWWDTDDIVPGQRIVPIGRPWGNTGLEVVGEDRRPRPIGCVGELMITGCQLAPGYLNRDALTAERFVAHGSRGDETGYLTGDLCRFLPDGNIEYIGRRDHQVKLRGLRIELGEIDAALRQVPWISDGVTIVSGEGERRHLVAYVVCRGEFDVDETRRHLLARLPEYMVPNVFQTLDDLPVNANGKVDRSALPPVSRGVTGASDTVARPANSVEQRLHALWCDVLGIEAMDRRTGFFEAGGHSLLLASLQHRLSVDLGVDVSMAHLLAHPTIEQLAASLSGSSPVAAEGRAGAMDRRRVAGFASRMKTSRPPAGRPPPRLSSPPVAVPPSGVPEVDRFDKA